MTCNHCVANVDKNIKALDGVTNAEVDLQNGKVEVAGEVSDEEIEQLINSLGYTYKGRA